LKESLLIIFFLIPMYSGFGQETEDDTSGILSALDGFFEWVGNVGKNAVKGAGVGEQQEELFDEAIDSSVLASKAGTNFWKLMHDALVDLIFAGLSSAGFEVDKQMISVVAIILTIVLIGLLIYGLVKKGMWIALGVVGIVIALGFAGIVIDF